MKKIKNNQRGGDFYNKVALVTGGTSGIGFAISKIFLENGAKVVALYKSDDKKAQMAVDELSKIGEFEIIKCDVTNEESVRMVYSKIKKLDCLINCAGISIEAPFEELAMEDIKKVMDVNLYGKMICSKYAIPLLKKSKCPRIVNIASRFAQKPFIEGVMGYCCSEAGIVMMTKVLALELAKYNIRVNTVSPSLTLTPMTRAVCSKEEIETIASKNPCKRLGDPLDIANAVLFLCSDKASYINGENLNVNGGILLI